MKKLYQFKTAAFGKAVGDTLEMDDQDANVKGLLANGTIVEDESAADGLIAKAIGELTASLSASYEAMAAKTIETVTAGLKGKGPVIEPGRSAEEKKKSLGHQLVQIATLGSEEATHHQKEAASNILKGLYGSDLSPWENAESKVWTPYGAVAKASGTQVENSGPAGGYGVFPEYSADIYKIAMEDTLLADKARKRPMTSNELRYPKLDQTGTNVGGSQTGYLGGVSAGWANETRTGNQTQAKLKQGILKAGELLGYTVASNELLADNGIGIEALLTELFSEAIAYYTDLATLVGDGVDKPTGVLTSTAALAVTRNTASAFVFADAIAMKAKLLPKSTRSAFWVMNQTVMPQLYNFSDASGRLIWLPSFSSTEGPAAVAAPERLLNMPIYWTEKTPSLGTKGDVMLIDPLGYMIGSRMALEIAASPHVNFLQREMTYRFVARIAGQPLLDKPFTMLDGSHQLSTFTILN